jgi:hypothetical protein
MAGFAPLIPTAVAFGVRAAQEVRQGNVARDAAEQGFAALQARQRLETDAAAADAATERARLGQDAAIGERQRRAALRRAVAARRTDMAGRGLDADGGSGEAILLGLTSDADLASADADAARRLREKAIDDDLATRRARNLLEQTDYAQRQQLAWLSRFG